MLFVAMFVVESIAAKACERDGDDWNGCGVGDGDGDNVVVVVATIWLVNNMS